MQTSKLEMEQFKTRTAGLKVFGIGFYRFRNVFECENAGGNEVGN